MYNTERRFEILREAGLTTIDQFSRGQYVTACEIMRLDIDHGTIVEVYDVPAGHPDLDHPCVTIVAQPADEPAPVDTQALLIERERLTARLAEINAILSGYGFGCGCGCGDHEMIHALPVIDEQRTKATEDAVNGPAGTTGDGK